MRGQYQESAYAAAMWGFQRARAATTFAQIGLVAAAYATGTMCLLNEGPGGVVVYGENGNHFQA